MAQSQSGSNKMLRKVCALALLITLAASNISEGAYLFLKDAGKSRVCKLMGTGCPHHAASRVQDSGIKNHEHSHKAPHDGEVCKIVLRCGGAEGLAPSFISKNIYLVTVTSELVPPAFIAYDRASLAAPLPIGAHNDFLDPPEHLPLYFSKPSKSLRS